MSVEPDPDIPSGDEVLIPRHVAIIMDGNGRWAQTRGLPRSEGHRRMVRKPQGKPAHRYPERMRPVVLAAVLPIAFDCYVVHPTPSFPGSWPKAPAPIER